MQSITKDYYHLTTVPTYVLYVTSSANKKTQKKTTHKTPKQKATSRSLALAETKQNLIDNGDNVFFRNTQSSATRLRGTCGAFVFHAAKAQAWQQQRGAAGNSQGCSCFGGWMHVLSSAYFNV
jgi:hypothetical protein